MSFWLPVYALTGVLAGLLAGLLGVGGGLVMVPALLFAFHGQGFDPVHLAHLAVGTSLAAIVPISLASAHAHYRHGRVEWKRVTWLAPGLVLGGWGGAWLAQHLDTQGLKTLFGIFLLLVALQMAVGYRPRAGAHRPLACPHYPWVGLGIGLISGLVGIGGGTLTVPFLVWQGRSMPHAVATSAACGLPIALAGAAGFFFFGRGSGLPAASGYIHWPALLVMAPLAVALAPTGARLAHVLPVARLKRIFSLVLLGVALRLLLG